MDIYTLGRCVFPVVCAIILVAALIMLMNGILTFGRTRSSQSTEQEQRPSVVIHFHLGRRAAKPPMREKR